MPSLLLVTWQQGSRDSRWQWKPESHQWSSSRESHPDVINFHSLLCNLIPVATVSAPAQPQTTWWLMSAQQLHLKELPCSDAINNSTFNGTSSRVDLHVKNLYVSVEREIGWVISDLEIWALCDKHNLLYFIIQRKCGRTCFNLLHICLEVNQSSFIHLSIHCLFENLKSFK